MAQRLPHLLLPLRAEAFRPLAQLRPHLLLLLPAEAFRLAQLRPHLLLLLRAEAFHLAGEARLPREPALRQQVGDLGAWVLRRLRLLLAAPGRLHLLLAARCLRLLLAALLLLLQAEAFHLAATAILYRRWHSLDLVRRIQATAQKA